MTKKTVNVIFEILKAVIYALGGYFGATAI